MKNFKGLMGGKDKDKDKNKKDVKVSSKEDSNINKNKLDARGVNQANNSNVQSNADNANLKGVPEQANLTIHSIFVKDISYEAPATPQAFSLPWEPQVKFDIQVMRRVVDQAAGVHEVILHTTISTKLKVKKAAGATAADAEQEITAFLIDIKLAGVFTIKGLQEPQLDRVLSTTAPTILFPYAAETVASLVTRGGFPQFILPPIDFATLYQQRLEQQQASNRPQTNQDSSTVS